MTELDRTFADLDEALRSGDDSALEEFVGESIAQLRQFDVTPDTTDRVAITSQHLQNNLQFEALIRYSDAALQNGHSGPVWGHLVQGLIEEGTYTAAQSVAERALNRDDLTPGHRQSLLGQAARIAKDLYFAHGLESDLRRAIKFYAQGVEEGGDLLWLGLNAHSLSHLARRRGLTVEPLSIPPESEIMARASAAAGAGDEADPWAIATLIESSMLVGLPVPVDTITHRLADAPPFVHASLRRQLHDVWELPDEHPAVVTLAEFSLRKGGDAEIILPEESDGYEKMFGTEWPIPIDTYRHGLQAAASVCHLLVGSSFAAGTGFVLSGDELHPMLAGRLAIITNEHVVPSLDRDGIRANELTASFDAHEFDPIGGFEGIWWSDRRDLDIAVLISEQLDSRRVDSLATSARLPVVRDGSYVYVVGHPGGAGLQLSIRGNSLIDHDGVRIHYRAPTSRGSSGSPVFDHEWKLIGVHHRGSKTLKALNSRGGHYDGNEGTSIIELRNQLQARPPSL